MCVEVGRKGRMIERVKLRSELFAGTLGWRGTVFLYGRWADVGRHVEEGFNLSRGLS